MKCMYKELIVILSPIVVIIIAVLKSKTNRKKKNEAIYKECLKFDYKELFESKKNNYEFLCDKFDIENIIKFIELLHEFKLKNNFKGIIVNLKFKKLCIEGDKIYKTEETNKINNMLLYDELESFIEFYNTNKDSFLSFKIAFIKFYKNIFGII